MTEEIRRIVTTHNQEGKAVVLSDSAVTLQSFPGMDARGALVWTTGTVPADNVTDLEGDGRSSGVTLAGGSVMRVTELGPGFTSPLHRTYSIDYCFVLLGELELILDGGDTVSLKPGDVVVQRGTNHAWRNPSNDKPCRFVVAMIESEPITFAGETLEKTPI